MLLEVRADNPRAQQLYRRFGFEQIHVRPRYYRDGVDALIMRLQLRRSRTRRRPPTEAGPRHEQHHSTTQPLVLGIESSCDETGVGIVRGTTLLTNTVSSSMDEHVRFGGVIPEIASRAHLDAFVPTLREALADAGVTLDDIDAIAVTSGPGLAGALMVGVCAAKALAVATGKPLYAINHLVAHVGVGLLDDDGGPAGRFAANALPATLCRRTWAPCWFPAGTPRSCGSAASPTTSSCWAPPSTTPPAKPTTRWPGILGLGYPGRPGHRQAGPRPATPRPSASRAD